MSSKPNARWMKKAVHDERQGIQQFVCDMPLLRKGRLDVSEKKTIPLGDALRYCAGCENILLHGSEYSDGQCNICGYRSPGERKKWEKENFFYGKPIAEMNREDLVDAMRSLYRFKLEWNERERKLKAEIERLKSQPRCPAEFRKGGER